MFIVQFLCDATIGLDFGTLALAELYFTPK